MHIVAFCINPLFPDRVMGGATKHLQSIAVHLGELGHTVTVLCTQRADSRTPFRWHENVRVKPLLRFKQPFPQPYDTPAYNLAAIIDDVAAHLETADRFYMHDGEFLFPYVYQHIPTIVSLRDNVYPETMLGGFLFQGDTLITISNYSRDFYAHTMGRFLPELPARIRVIHNGLDWNQFRPTPPDEILQIGPIDPAHDAILIHPHRPEPSKGLTETIAVADRLVHQYGFDNLKVLVPKWIDVTLSVEMRAYYDAVQQQLAERQLANYFIFHDWIPQSLMPQYYSLGGVTLALGHFVESFGNAVYESLGCGTPAIAARISTHRELLPDFLLDKVHFGDTEMAAALAAGILQQKRRTSPATLAYLHEHYSVARQRAAYADAILNASRRGPLAYRYKPLTQLTQFRLAPWCYRWEGKVYHDFHAAHEPLPLLLELLDAHPDGFSLAAAEKVGVTAVTVDAWYRDGLIVPLLAPAG